MFKRKPSPEMEAIKAVWSEIQEAETERKAAMERLRSFLQRKKEEDMRFAQHWGGG